MTWATSASAPPRHGRPHRRAAATSTRGATHSPLTGPWWRQAHLEPCGAPGSSPCCGFWSWLQEALSTSTGPAVGCVLWRSKDLLQSPSCSVCTSPSSPPALGTGPAAPTGPSTGLPTAAALDWLLQGPATPAAPAGRGPAGFLGPVKLQYASHHAGTEGTVPSRDAAAALQDGGETPARRTWTNAAPEGPAVPSAVSTRRAVTRVSAGRGRACLQMGLSACPREGPPGWPRTRQEQRRWCGRRCAGCSLVWTRWSRSCS
ncbi:epidermal growth factor-like protein 7 isoform X2 [Dipodomys spectabilis]|uniref:epidermal growth factor-like protein 7 isoform X2 n=1 Tax=Dipodomys spectabilis TaxID=105255 RepID=UPI001C542E06|nr:epidermal growth factor-like protein 7 isoform X2 [Dipodomys spectabilis]